VGVFGISAALWAAGFVWFATSLPEAVGDPARKTDAIVVLTGGSGRVGQGLRLLADRRAERLFVSGVYRGVEVEDLLKAQDGAAPDPEARCCVTLGYEALSTRGNAAETARWIEGKDIASLRLVTAAYHMPRSLLEFRRAMPGIDLVPHPVFPEHVKQHAWWRWPGSAALLVQEYNKYLVTLLRGLIPPTSARSV
jgi:uncharacterized SAM-binding protein YcdF (DUF218 family)